MTSLAEIEDLKSRIILLMQANLPPGMNQLNYSLVQTLVPVGLQSVEEIEQIVQQATRSAAWPGPSPAFGQWDA